MPLTLLFNASFFSPHDFVHVTVYMSPSVGRNVENFTLFLQLDARKPVDTKHENSLAEEKKKKKKSHLIGDKR